MARPLLRSTALVVLVSGLAVAPLALAHPSLVRSTPAADATVAPASQIELQFSEKVMPRATRIELSMDHGRMKMAMPTTAQELSEDGHTLRARFAKPCRQAATHCSGARWARTATRSPARTVSP
jgi:methionine-rich copper-binding protein CopC